mmetsp:Transcript_99830/g.281868  ORF Transcript_99830/g.281868 Transcript_99830/m.281868 type:complete len:92 (+) Transcript_99830:569-844(+)
MLRLWMWRLLGLVATGLLVGATAVVTPRRAPILAAAARSGAPTPGPRSAAAAAGAAAASTAVAVAVAVSMAVTQHHRLAVSEDVNATTLEV